MAELNIKYSSNQTITCDVASLTSSSTFTSGRESNQIDNATTNKFVDAIVKGKVTVGSTPAIDSHIFIFVWGSDVSLATEAIDTLDGIDSDESLSNSGILDSAFKLGAVIRIGATTDNLAYDFAPFSVARLFGGSMPKFWGLYVTHNTGSALNVTAANHVFRYVGVTYTIV